MYVRRRRRVVRFHGPPTQFRNFNVRNRVPVRRDSRGRYWVGGAMSVPIRHFDHRYYYLVNN